jgi:hypothetical protein
MEAHEGIHEHVFLEEPKPVGPGHASREHVDLDQILHSQKAVQAQWPARALVVQEKELPPVPCPSSQHVARPEVSMNDALPMHPANGMTKLPEQFSPLS